jgi:predicted AlkP superfamily phosphohydrolase/phosphomutase
MPAKRYQAFWPHMSAFALPSFYDGRVRVNLEGREAHGIVPRARYRAELDEIADLLRACTEPIHGRDVVESIEYFDGAPEELPDSQADLTVVWRNAPIGLDHERLGRIGPLPWRRTGGHTGDTGFLFLANTRLEPATHGRVSSFDVVPTLLGLLDRGAPAHLSGRSLLGWTSPDRRPRAPNSNPKR